MEGETTELDGKLHTFVFIDAFSLFVLSSNSVSPRHAAGLHGTQKAFDPPMRF